MSQHINSRYLHLLLLLVCFNPSDHTAGSGQREAPRLVLEEGLQLCSQPMPEKLKSPHFKVLSGGAGTSAFQALLPEKLKSPQLQAQVWGGSSCILNVEDGYMDMDMDKHIY